MGASWFTNVPFVVQFICELANITEHRRVLIPEKSSFSMFKRAQKERLDDNSPFLFAFISLHSDKLLHLNEVFFCCFAISRFTDGSAS